jgi:hypothetical protein
VVERASPIDITNNKGLLGSLQNESRYLRIGLRMMETLGRRGSRWRLRKFFGTFFGTSWFWWSWFGGFICVGVFG